MAFLYFPMGHPIKLKVHIETFFCSGLYFIYTFGLFVRNYSQERWIDYKLVLFVAKLVSSLLQVDSHGSLLGITHKRVNV